MSKKHFYVTFDDNVPKDIVKQYNRVIRKEEYILEKDALGSAIFFGSEDELFKHNIMKYIQGIETDKEAVEEQENEILLLKKALVKLKEKYPAEYEIVRSYYFSAPSKTMAQLASERNISKQAVSRLLKRAYVHLKELVISYKE